MSHLPLDGNQRASGKLRIAYGLIILNVLAAISSLTGERSLCELTGRLLTNPSADILVYYLNYMVGYNAFTLAGMALAYFEWRKHKNPSAKRLLAYGSLAILLVAVTY